MQVLQAIGYGIVGFAVIVVIGIVVMQRLGDSVASCSSGFAYNSTTRLCYNTSNTSQTASASGNGYTTANYLSTQLGSSGLSGWIPAVIAVAIGGLFLALFGGKKNKY